MRDPRGKPGATSTTIAIACPICGGDEFQDYRGRAASQCAGCGSKERGRLMALALGALPLDPGTFPVYHFAPERSISKLLHARYGSQYTPADIEPDRYPWSSVPLRRVDLSRTPDFLAPRTVGGMVHSHVLEHVPGSIERVVGEMNAAIAHGGFHVFQVPIIRGWYREDMDPDLGDEERLRLFFQEDHLRMFGDRDLDDRLLRLFDGFSRVDVAERVTHDEAVAAGVPVTALTRHTGHSVYAFVKDR